MKLQVQIAITLFFLMLFSPIAFSLKTLHNEIKTLEDYPENVLVLNFWATWCKPCEEEFPRMNDLFKKNRGKSVMVLGVSVIQDDQKVKKFLQKNKVDFPILIDNSEVLADQFNITVLPTTIILNRKAKEIYKLEGYSSAGIKKIQELIDRFVSK